MTTEMRIYIGVLADYNNGVLHGGWIACEGLDADDLQTAVNGFLRTSHYPNVLVDCPECDGAGTLTAERNICPTCKGTGKVPSAEEYAIHDSEGFYGMVSEYTSLTDVATIAELIGEHGEAYALYAANLGGDTLPTSEDFQDAYHGTWDSFKAYAEDYVDSTGMLSEMPEHLQNYFDMEAYARDLEQNYMVLKTSSHDVAVFSNC